MVQLTPFDFWFLLIIGLIVMVGNIINARHAGQPRPEDQKNYQGGHLYALDALCGLVLVLIAFQII